MPHQRPSKKEKEFFYKALVAVALEYKITRKDTLKICNIFLDEIENYQAYLSWSKTVDPGTGNRKDKRISMMKFSSQLKESIETTRAFLPLCDYKFQTSRKQLEQALNILDEFHLEIEAGLKEEASRFRNGKLSKGWLPSIYLQVVNILMSRSQRGQKEKIYGHIANLHNILYPNSPINQETLRRRLYENSSARPEK